MLPQPANTVVLMGGTAGLHLPNIIVRYVGIREMQAESTVVILLTVRNASVSRCLDVYRDLRLKASLHRETIDA